MRTSERHQLKQDKFAQTTKGIITSAAEHRSSITWSVGIAAAVLLLAIGLWWYWGYRNQQANVALGKAVETYQAALVPAGTTGENKFHSRQERARAAHTQFQQVVDRYGRTKPGQMARYLAGLAAVDAGDTKTGEAQLKQVGESGHKDLAALAKLALAGVYRGSNRHSEALRLYQDLIAHPTTTVSKAMAQLELGSYYEATNQPTEAGKLYDELVKGEPQSAAAGIAEQRLQTLK